MAGSDADFTIRVILDPSPALLGLRKVEGGIKRVQDRTEKLRRLIRNAFTFFAGGIAIRKLLDLADTLLRVQNRLRVVTEGSRNLRDTQEELFNIARRTRSEFAATAELYSRVAINSTELGRSQEELLQFTESLNKAIIISGASAKEANSGLIQLSQGLASGALRGDELRSVLEQLPVVADVIAKHLGVTRGELRILGEEGKVSAKNVIDSFAEAREELDQRFRKTLPTIGQAFTVLNNSVLKFYSKIEEGSGVGKGFAKVILKLADNFEVFGRAAIAAAIALGVHFAKVAIGNTIKALGRLAIALLSNPLTALPTVITLVIAALIAFGDQIELGAGSIGNLYDLAAVTFIAIKEAIVDVVGLFMWWFGTIAPAATAAFGKIDFSVRNILLGVAVTVDTAIGMFTGLFDGVVAMFSHLPKAVGDAGVVAMNGQIAMVEFFIDLIIAATKTAKVTVSTLLFGMVESFVLVGQAAKQALVGNFGEAKRLTEEAAEVLKNSGERAFSQIPQVFSANLEAATRDQLLPRIENMFAGGAEEMGAAVMKAFTGGMDVTMAQDFLSKMLAAAQARADARQAEAAKPEEGGLAAGLGGTGSANEGIQKKLDALTAENELVRTNLELTDQQFAVKQELFDIEAAFRAKNVEMSAVEEETLQRQLAQMEEQLTLQQQLNAQVSMLKEIRGEDQMLVERQQALNQLFADGVITVEEYTQKLQALKIEEAELGTSVSDGMVTGMAKVRESIEDLAGATENVLVNAFQGAEDALVEFATTGKLNMKEFAMSIIADITRVIAKMLLMKAIEGLSGVPGLSGLAGKASGGRVGANETVVVGEEGPEIWDPSTSGTVIPNDATTAALGTQKSQQPTTVVVPAPVVNVPVTNVSDPDEIPAAIESPEGEEAIINVVRRNANVLRAQLR